MNAQNTLSPAIVRVLLESVADGKLRASALVPLVQNEQALTWGDHKAVFKKNAPSSFTVTFFKNGEQVGEEFASAPVEAKLMVLEYLGDKIAANGNGKKAA